MKEHFNNEHPAFSLVTGDRLLVTVRDPASEELSYVREAAIFVRLSKYQSVFVYIWGQVVEVPFNQIHFDEK